LSVEHEPMSELAAAQAAAPRCGGLVFTRACGYLIVCGGLLACSGYSRTPRTAGGVPIDDRPISASAYGSFLEGALFEAERKWPEALDAFREALNRDGASVEIQTRIAAVTCRLYPEAATAEFEAAAERDETFAPMWREWAECELGREKTVRALRLAKEAVTHAPYSLPATVTLSRVYEARQEPTLALRTLIAFVLRFEDDTLAWRALYDCAQRQKDPVWAHRAAPHLTSGARLRADVPNGAELLVRVALLERGLSAARDTAIEQGVEAATVAWIALESGRPSEALKQAQLVLRADPTNFDAAVAGLMASQRTSQDDLFHAGLRELPPPVYPISTRAKAAIAKLLQLYFGPLVRRDFELALSVEGPSNGRSVGNSRKDEATAAPLAPNGASRERSLPEAPTSPAAPIDRGD
jgi:tetratricopeptide (TPR) repeat protein